MSSENKSTAAVAISCITVVALLIFAIVFSQPPQHKEVVLPSPAIKHFDLSKQVPKDAVLSEQVPKNATLTLRWAAQHIQFAGETNANIQTVINWMDDHTSRNDSTWQGIKDWLAIEERFVDDVGLGEPPTVIGRIAPRIISWMNDLETEIKGDLPLTAWSNAANAARLQRLVDMTGITDAEPPLASDFPTPPIVDIPNPNQGMLNMLQLQGAAQSRMNAWVATGHNPYGPIPDNWMPPVVAPVSPVVAPPPVVVPEAPVIVPQTPTYVPPAPRRR